MSLISSNDLPAATPAEVLIEVSGVSKSYGGVKALIDCDFSCKRGEVHALLGENGAGKSTLVKILCGVVKPDSGMIRFKGQEAQIHSPVDASHKGIVAVFQELSLIPDLSVAENVYLGHEPLTKWGLIDFRQMNEKTEQLLQNLGLHIPCDSLVRDLSLSERQLLEIAKALSRDPEIIILDEATSALGQQEVELLFSIIKRLTAQGMTAIFISHRMDELAKIADRATVFRDARYITTFDWGTVSNEQIVNWIAGRTVKETYPEKKHVHTDDIALEVVNLSSDRNFQHINLQLKKGEIVGIAGLQGHGQSQFLQALFGACPITSGEVRVAGDTIVLSGPKSAIDAGIALVPEDRKNEGLLLTRSVKENLTLMTLGHRQSMGIIRADMEGTEVQRLIQLLNIKTPHPDLEVGGLSGGNQQKVVIGKAVMTEAAVLLLADPTRGIDIGTKAEIYQLMRNLADDGISLLFYSTELPELVGVCDRVAVFKQGRISAMLHGSSITEHHIINAALGISQEVNP
ncbi:ATP-binding cassette domain-containing protein [Paenibacillus sp. LMG 31456]|uniref:ATP-binding cassette domain-containing protein n=1 Tax=Paenibacillus foliorum TaxID=2654974 RepID=A0A972K4T2_9BACL|nr:sugar ABC transporter ATP-binding protein [Paenibacillus foliorum]NOU96337.1 ATP-binding cassette domain-containing protein [Paenibacillus foliorum]